MIKNMDEGRVDETRKYNQKAISRADKVQKAQIYVGEILAIKERYSKMIVEQILEAVEVIAQGA